MARKTKLERFNEHVLSKFEIYNSLFLTLPFDSILKTSLLLPLFSEHCKSSYNDKKSPLFIVESFLNPKYKEIYPFSKIVGNANILIMPGQHSAAISYKIMKSLGGAKVVGPLLIGLAQPIEIAPLRSSTSEILNLASVAAYSAGIIEYKKTN